MSKVAIGDLVEFRRGVSWSAFQESDEPGPGRVPVLRIPNIRERLNTSDLVYLSGIDRSVQKSAAASRGWILMVGSNGNPDRIGNAVLIDKDTDYLFASFLVGLKPNPKLVYDRFLLARLHADDVRALLRVTVHGSTGLQNINLKSLAQYEIDLPSPREQQHIAEILDTLDGQISTTDRLIAKFNIVKTGFLHDLLTRGLDERGMLRPACAEAPHLYKDSSLGPVPAKWVVAPLAQSLNGSPTNGVYKPPGSIGRGTLLIGQTAFTEDRKIDYRLARRALMTRDDIDRYSLQSGDILVSRVFATLEGVGQPTYVEALPEPAVFESNMMRLRIDESVAMPEFISSLLQTEEARRHVVRNANLSNQASINQAALASLPTALPPKAEQQQICEAIRAIDATRRTEAATGGALRLLKLGLSADLLTGRVRVAEEVSS